MTSFNVEEQLNNPKKSLIKGYFEIQRYYETKYGVNTIVIIELGSFFEIYGVESAALQVGRAREIADLLNIQLTRKNKNIKENSLKNPLMAGFPTATFDRYISRLIQEKKYTIVVIRQKGIPPQVTRYVDKIISPGVNIDYCLDHSDNFVSSVLIEEHNGIYSVGYAAIDITTGKTHVFEGHSTSEDPTAALDELFGLLQSHTMAEIILIFSSKNIDQAHIIQYLELTDFENIQIRTNNFSITYQNELFKRAYVIQSFLSPIEFLDLEKSPLTSASLAHLLEFIVDHDSEIIANLKKPVIIDTKKFVYLGNNPLEQLNILSKDPRELTILSLFDMTSTSIGKRLLKDRITNPITDKVEIESRYTISDALAKDESTITQELRKIYDLERIARRIKLRRLHPFEINFLHESLCAAYSLIELISKNLDETLLTEFLSTSHTLHDYIIHIEETFNLDETTRVTNQSIHTSLFQQGYQNELDLLLQQKGVLYQKLETIKKTFSDLLHKNTGKLNADAVTIKQLDKDGHHLTITKGRFSLIENSIADAFVSIDNTVYALSDFRYKSLTTNVKITADVISQISKEITQVNSKIVALVKDLFNQELQYIDTHFSDFLELCCHSLAKIDVAISNVKCTKKYCLVRPEIIDAPLEDSYISLHGLRHPLVESAEENGIYVPNDVVLGSSKYYSESDADTVIAQQSESDTRGLLLYGINSSGKSSLMKSLGITVILAQSGCYVPTNTMHFSIFNELFTRVVSKDNFEKGLSSFAVEMLELKNIFNRCSPRSLILGDEISHGTETLSAIAIVAATIQRLSEQKALFLFTTHLHQIHDLDLTHALTAVACVHMSVHYDEQKDQLIFDRTLKSGNGSSVYGLEFAQSLHMDSKFLKYATDIRKKLTNDYSDLESLTKKDRSKYHKNLYLSSCAICKKPVDDTHHIAPQQDANNDGNIGHFHKDHKYNLLPICKECHKAIHDKKIMVKGFMMTSNGLELMYDDLDDSNHSPTIAKS